jgi:hypothetical protein
MVIRHGIEAHARPDPAITGKRAETYPAAMLLTAARSA